MITNILTLKVGDKYGPEYINRLYSAICRNTSVDFNFYCYTEDGTGIIDEVDVIPLELRNDVVKQWYKIDFHHMPQIRGKCLILDIDYIIVNNIDDVLSWDLPKNHFGCNYRWWSNMVSDCKINGGFQMFYQGETKHLYDIFYTNPSYWQTHYIKIGKAEGPVNGEQNFVDDNIQLKRSWLPMEWFGKMCTGEVMKFVQLGWLKNIDNSTVFYMNEEFDERVKMIHFSDPNNMIEDYEQELIKECWND